MSDFKYNYLSRAIFSKLVELLKITNGHDFCKMLLHELKVVYSSMSRVTSINVNALELFLMGYNLNYFKRTQLFKKINDYQSRHSLQFISWSELC